MRHLWKRVAVVVEMLRGSVPPDWEMLFQSAAQVGTVGCWLHHQFMEGLVRSSPVGSLYLEEEAEAEGGRQSQDLVLGLGAEDWSHERISQTPADSH